MNLTLLRALYRLAIQSVILVCCLFTIICTYKVKKLSSLSICLHSFLAFTLFVQLKHVSTQNFDEIKCSNLLLQLKCYMILSVLYKVLVYRKHVYLPVRTANNHILVLVHRTLKPKVQRSPNIFVGV